ncbi:hypothetical protein COCON_G00114880 [Conger conger]|uniref:B30.2/SPRY domain-containing protein n=1 Tax=Conger conger TaxID=82655 RepID=A0A9Q1DG04_CONCO|nr:tripartite motif-containing protein 14 [Conger conger]KAJ8268881.1 hypothetical protein COCON_G00114880 [Conger conger]
MAEEVKEIPAAQMLAAVSQVGTAPPAVNIPARQPSPLCLPPQDPTTEEGTLPYPRSPRLSRKAKQPATLSREALSRHLEELQAERSGTEAHLQSLKKRSDDLSRSAEAMKQQIGERFEIMRQALQREEQAAVDWVEQDRREASGRLNRVLKDWTQHLNQVQKNIVCAKRALEQAGKEGPQEYTGDLSCRKKEDAAQEGIKMSEGRFQRLLKALRNISKDLQAQLQRRNFLLDSVAVQIDRQACNRHIALGRDQRLMYFTSEPRAGPELPLQFDRVCCALGSVGMATGRHYWEVDVGCCSAWAVGATYACIERKGVEKGAKLGRNRHSWCVELREGRLSAWHNDHHVACRVGGRKPLRRVGVLLDYQRGRLAFHDARTMKQLQEFSAVLTPVFDRMHHQFMEPVFPAFRFFRPDAGQLGPSHMEVCDLHL